MQVQTKVGIDKGNPNLINALNKLAEQKHDSYPVLAAAINRDVAVLNDNDVLSKVLGTFTFLGSRIFGMFLKCCTPKR